MKQFFSALLFVVTVFNSQAGQVNNSNNSGYNVATQMEGLISACIHKNVFNLLIVPHHIHYDPQPKTTQKTCKSIALLEEKCGVTIIKDKNTDAFSAPFNANLYKSSYLVSFYEAITFSEEGRKPMKAELERISTCFEVVCCLLKIRIIDKAFDDQETEAAEFLVEEIEKNIEHIQKVLSYSLQQK